MKKLVFILFLILFAKGNILAQATKDIRLNFGFQRNLPERVFNSKISKYNDKNGGGSIHIYPKWFYNKKLSIGINMEYAFVIENYQTDAIGIFNIFSFSPTCNYYFSESKIRPFAGLGVGAYHVLYHSPKLNTGIKPLIGLNIYDYFELSLEYNRILNDINVDPDVMGDFDNYYVGIKSSFSIGLFQFKKQ